MMAISETAAAVDSPSESVQTEGGEPTVAADTEGEASRPSDVTVEMPDSAEEEAVAAEALRKETGADATQADGVPDAEAGERQRAG